MVQLPRLLPRPSLLLRPELLTRPGELVGLAMSAAGRVAQAGAAVVALPARVLGLIDTTELLVARLVTVLDHVELLAGRAEALIARADGVVGAAEQQVREVRALTAAAALAAEEAARVAGAAGTVVAGAEVVAERVAVVVGAAAGAAGTADELLASYAPALRRGAPMAERFVSQLTEDEVTAAIRLLDELPRLTHHVTENVLPILSTLDRVGPDIHELLEVTRDLRFAIAGIPGLGMLRRRGEDRLADDAAG